MSSTPYKVGVVGANWIAAGHPGNPATPFKNQIIDSHVACLSLMERIEVVGICDISMDMLNDFKENWGDRWPNANIYTDYKEMLDKEDLDIVTVATPEHMHASITIDAARSGVRGIYCEKPLATSLADADRMIETCEKNDVVLIVGYTRRWRLLFNTVLDAIHDGVIGQLGTIICSMGGDRALLFRNGTHYLDAMCFFSESDPIKVFASLEEGFEDWDRYKGVGGMSQDDPGATGYVLFKNGVHGIYSSTKNGFMWPTLQLAGPKGQIFFGVNDRVAKLTTMGEGRNDYVSRTLVPKEYQVQAMVAAFEELVDVIEDGVSSVSPAREARKSVQIIEGFLRSQQLGGHLIDIPE